jgi:hypothetical protein
VAAIVASIVIGRSPDVVFAYAVDPANLPKWQENVVSASHEVVLGPGTRVVTVRRLGKREQTITMEMTGYDGPERRRRTGFVRWWRPGSSRSTTGPGAGSPSSSTSRGTESGSYWCRLVRPEARKGLPRNLALLRRGVEDQRQFPTPCGWWLVSWPV